MGSRVDLCTCSPPGTPASAAAPRGLPAHGDELAATLGRPGPQPRRRGARRSTAGGPWVVPRAMRMANTRFRTTERVMKSVAAFAHATTGTSRRPPTPRGRSR